jgi:DNA-binding MarR family transcriptional regulator
VNPTCGSPPCITLDIKIHHIKLDVKRLDINFLCVYIMNMKRDPFDRVRDQWEQERPDLDTSGLEVLWRISFLHKDLRRAAGRRLSRVDLPNWAFDVLASLRRQGSPFQMSPSELCEAAMLTSGAMTNRLDRLEDAGLVERRPDPDDRRSLSVELTERGKELVDKALEIRFEHANQALASLSESERSQLVGLLRKLVAARVMA